MRKFLLLFPLLLLLGAAIPAISQVPKDVTVPLTASVSSNPSAITLSWPMPAVGNVVLYRHLKTDPSDQWEALLDTIGVTIASFKDENVIPGQVYEYVIQRNINLNAFGYAHVALNAPVVHERGKLILYLDKNLTQPLAAEIARLKSDLIGDGWQLLERVTSASPTVQSVKNQIVADYNADPANVKGVFLLGDIPIPYAGNTQWDGHPEHKGAWPSDAYYADVNGVWTDNVVNNNLAARVANNNVPGDGKFDQDFIPSPVELMVGRVNFSRMDAAAFGVADQAALYKRYLDKDHAWRTGAYTVENKALVDDNFGYFGGEAFAANGFRNAYPLVGEANVLTGDFFADSKTSKWLMGYGTGPGSYVSAGGVGSSAEFATETVNIVFSNLFGSYHGDWDYESNPFMVAALASKGGILTCSWAGRPHHFYQALASGESIGFVMKETMNAPYSLGFYASLGEAGSHIALLGDPTLRANVVPPATAVSAQKSNCSDVTLNWTASSGNVTGYYVYRALSPDGPYTRITSNAITATTFTDASAPLDTLYYQVRAVSPENNPAGGIYMNNSTGAFASFINSSGQIPEVTAKGGIITCNNPAVVLMATTNAQNPKFTWSGPGNYTSSVQNPTVTVAGIYTVTVMADNGCMNSATTTVTENKTLPLPPIAKNAPTLNCTAPCQYVYLNSFPDVEIYYLGKLVKDSVLVCQPGLMALTFTNLQNGCTGTAQVSIMQDIAPPTATATATGDFTVDCISPEVKVTLEGKSNVQNVTYKWNGPNSYTSNEQKPVVDQSGVYTLTVTNIGNGCTATATVEIKFKNDFNDPVIKMEGNTQLTCLVTSTQICAESTPVGVTYKWAGPNIFTSNIKCPNITSEGIYTVTVTASSGCTGTASVEVTADADVPNFVINGNPILSCTNPSTSICADSETPGAIFTWTFEDGTTITDSCITAAKAGKIICKVTAPNGCSAEDEITLSVDAAVPDLSLPFPLPVLNCKNPCVTVTPSSNTPGVSITAVTACEPGIYQVEVLNPANGCTKTASVMIEKREIKAEPIIVNLPCEGPGNAKVVASGGNPPYSYLWSNGATADSIPVPAGGTVILSVLITDADSCSINVGPATIVQVPPIAATPLILNESGQGAKDGSISLSITGGKPSFTYKWSTGASTPSISNLAGGTYTCTITDARGCTKTVEASVKTLIATHEAAWIGSLTLSPNPTMGLALLEIRLLEAAPLRLRLHDAAGRLVWEKWPDATAELTQQIDLQEYATGVYHLSIQSHDRVAVRKLVFMR